MESWGQTVLLSGGIAFAAFVAFLYWNQENMLYHPVIPGSPRLPAENPVGYRSPKDYDISFEDIYCKTSDGAMVHSWLLKHRTETKERATILFFHGNAGNIGYRLPNAAKIFETTGCNIVLVDYRGYGNSQGIPTEEGLKVDAQTVLNHILSLDYIDSTKIIVFGRSLGGAVAVALADSVPEKVRALILENTFLSIDAMVDHLMPVLRVLKRFILRLKWDSRSKISSLAHPILFIAGEKDELVPHAHMIQLHELATRSAMRRWVPISSGSHNDTWLKGGSKYYEAMKSFVVACTSKEFDADPMNFPAEDTDPDSIPNMPKSRVFF